MKKLLQYPPLIIASFLFISAAGASVLINSTYPNPTKIPGLVMWLKADAIAGSDGDTIATWSDSSGHGNDMTTRGTGPTLSTNVLNGKPVLTFTTSKSLLSAISFPSTYTVLYVGRETGGQNERMLTSGLGNNWLLGAWHNSMNVAFYEGWLDAVNSHANIAPDTNWRLFIGESNGTRSDGYANGEHILTSTSAVVAPMGLGLNDGQYSGETSDMQIAEVIAYNTTLTQPQRASLEIYFKNKYGIDITPEVTGTVTVGGANVGSLTHGLVGYWKFDEGSGTTAADSSGSGNNGTLEGGLSWDTGKYNSALAFSGTNDVSLGTNGIPIGNEPYTMSAWIKTSYMGAYGIIGWGNWGTNNAVNALRLGSGGVLNYWWGNDLACGAALGDDTWHLVTATFDGTTRSIYVDGSHCVSDTPTGHSAVASDVKIGRTNGTEYFPGDIDDVRIYDRALSSYEIQALYQNKPGVPISQTSAFINGLEAHWTLDSGSQSGSDMLDASGNNYSSSIVGAASFVAGQVDDAFHFNGSTMLQSTYTLPTSAYTKSAWVRLSSCVSNNNIISSAGDDGTAFFAPSGAGCELEAGENTVWNLVHDSASLAVNTWYFVTVTYDSSLAGGTLKLYKDGKLVSTATSVVPPAASAIYIGGHNAGNYWNGDIDDVRIYNRALSADELHSLYIGGRPPTTTVNDSHNSRATSGLVGLWSFDGPDISWGSNTAYDRSGGGHDGTLVNVTKSAATPGKVGQGLHFNGSAYVSTSYTIPAQNSSTSFTWSTWIKPDAGNGPNTVILGFRNGLHWMKLTPTRFEYWDGTTDNNVTIPVGKWSLVTVVKNNSTITYYLNGVATTTATDSRSVDAGPFYIGADPDFPGDGVFKGTLDDVRVYNRALAPSEVHALDLMGS